MQDEAAFDPRRFISAAAHYRSGRSAYAPALIRRVAVAAGLQGEHRVLDLGCGPGQLAIGFAYFAGEVLGLDPEPNMVAAAEAAAQGLVPNVVFRLGSSLDLGVGLGMFRLVAMGRSFHWMDRAETLRRLDGLIGPGGAVTLFHDSHPDVPENAWRAGWREILDRYDTRAAPGAQRKSQHWVRHEAALRESAFRVLERYAVTEKRVVSIESLIDRGLSMSGTSPSRLGARREALVRDLRAFLTSVATDGGVTEIVESAAVLARRDGAAV